MGLMGKLIESGLMVGYLHCGIECGWRMSEWVEGRMDKWMEEWDEG